MEQWTRFFYQPSLPVGRDGTRATGSKEHIALSREAAAEGMVLVKNEHSVLPLGKGARVALFGKGCVDYVKGGGGSGDVTVAYVRSLLEGMRCKEQEGKVHLYPALGAFYEEEVSKQYAQGIAPGLTSEPELPETLLAGARAFTDTAIISICRFSGENWDRTIQSEDGSDTEISEFQAGDKWLIDRASEVFEHGDFYLSKAEACLVSRVKEVFDRVIVVLNVGGMVDTSWFKSDDRIQSVLMAWQGGMEGGLAAADLLCGDANPSGKLVDTFAKRLEDYPSSAGFHESLNYVDYTEDIYVGYRYFETVPGKAEQVNYPFGYGLSYTKFMIEMRMAGETADGLDVLAAVTNIGSRAGKEVVQLYAEAPQGKLGKPKRELKAFVKTRLLAPGETQTVRLHVRFSSLASYDDLGKVKKSCYVLEQGDYHFHLGTSVRDTMQLDYVYRVDQDTVVAELSSKCAPTLLKERMKADGTMEALPQQPEKVRISTWAGVEKAGYFAPPIEGKDRQLFFGDEKKAARTMFKEVLEGTCSLEQFMSQLSLDDMIHLLCGQPNTGVANTFGFGNLPDYDVPNVMTADGPAGLRIQPVCGVNTTAFPCATLLACCWNPELVARVGEAGATEVVENNIGVWLTPAMNIHRSPLCGRNFEYYSEDPLIAGKTGAAMVRGIQSQGVAASVKHFACNNKETCRFESDSRVSERALREIYLKGFEIVVREADPWTIMTSYNILNGQRTSENHDLLTGILREEWGFQGMLTTDWWNHASQPLEILAGNDVKMGCGYPEDVRKAYEDGVLGEQDIKACAKRVLELILKVGSCR
jgi:beta-glucosidase